MFANEYDIGDEIRCTALFSDFDGDAVDPTALTFKIKDPAGVVITLVYSVDAALLRLTTGSYYVDVDADLPGTWHYQFRSTGAGKASAERSFFVKQSEI